MRCKQTQSPNYVVVFLCDSDFSAPLEFALSTIWDYAKRVRDSDTVESYKQTVIALMTAYCKLRDYNTDHVEQYLQTKLSVVFSDVAPSVDHGGGSAAIDCNLGYIWRF